MGLPDKALPRGNHARGLTQVLVPRKYATFGHLPSDELPFTVMRRRGGTRIARR